MIPFLKHLRAHLPIVQLASPEYSPVVQYSPIINAIMELPDWTSETTSESATTFSDDDNDEPLVEQAPYLLGGA